MFLPAVILIFSGCSRTTDKDRLTQLVDKIASHRSIHYKVSDHLAYSWSPDTIVTPYEVWAVRDESDTLRHGYVWVNNYYRPYNMIYEQGDLYLVIPPKKITILYHPYPGPVITNTDWINYFLDPQQLLRLAADSTVKMTYRDTLWQGKESVLLSISYEKDNSKQQEKYILDKKRSVPLYAFYSYTGPQQSFSEELFFSDYTFDDVEKDSLKEKQSHLLAENPVDISGGNSEAARLEKMLHTGEKAPLVTGTFYANGKPFALKDYTGKYVIIVDFWYTHCPPCVKAIPALSEFYSEYRDKGLRIFGLNSVDNQPRSMENLKRFLKKREVSYDIILTRPEVDMQYKINGYPSMYVIDKKGNIAWVEIGFYEDRFEKMKEKVKELLKQ